MFMCSLFCDFARQTKEIKAIDIDTTRYNKNLQ